ncbi:hypothetical protein Tco_0179298 [Tanacetum coccineum]
MPKCHTRNHHILPSRSVNARRAADHNRKLHIDDHNQFVKTSLKSVNTKTPQTKHSVNHSKKVWKATRNHIVNTTKTAWRPTGKVVGSLIATLVIERLVPRGYLVFLNAKALPKGRTVLDSIAERLTRPTAYKFKTDCSIIPVWVQYSYCKIIDPHEIRGNFLTPRADISFAVYESVNRDKVIIEDWNSNDEDDVSEMQIVSPVKTNEIPIVKTRVDKIGQTSQKQGIGFKKIKACFVKDCNFHNKQSHEPKLKTVVNTGPRVDKPV